MKCLSTLECESEIASLGVSLGEARGKAGFLDGSPMATTLLEIPDSSRRQALAVKTIFSFYETDEMDREQPRTFLLWLQGWDSWPSESFPELWDEIRERHGEKRPRIEAPGHLFAPAEASLACGMTRLAILFGWDAFLISDPISFMISMDNDNGLYLYSRTPSLLDELAQSLTRFFPRMKGW